MSKEALILFVKNPVAGKVKTRLAKDIGPEGALEVYEELLRHTVAAARGLGQSKFVYYSDFVPAQGPFDHTVFTPMLQDGSDLGGRMSGAFEEVFAKGYQKVAIIGSDCPELDTCLIQEAFTRLEGHDFVVGPARDGGYYLLGMKQPEPGIFQNIAWSTPAVYQATAEYLQLKGRSFYVLPPLSDVDTVEDLDRLRNKFLKGS